jgi:MYXO-CTERM domain-containing protein
MDGMIRAYRESMEITMRHWIPTFLLAAAWPGVAGANPVSAERLVVRQVPATTHVQVTVAYDTAYASDSAVVSATRDGTQLDGTWAAASVYQTNMGSGVVSVAGHQYCDCNVPTGSHNYAVITSGANGYSYERTLEVVEHYTLPEATGGGGYMGAWQEPDPIEVQGIDCVAHCNEATDSGGEAGPSVSLTGAAGAAASTGGGPSEAHGDAETVDSGRSVEGCHVAPGPAGGSGSATWLLLGVLLLRRRPHRSNIQA